MFDREKLRQALSEFGHTFIITFVPLGITFWTGVSTGEKVVIPDYGTVRAFLTAAAGASALAGLKAAWWYLTGTKAPRP